LRKEERISGRKKKKKRPSMAGLTGDGRRKAIDAVRGDTDHRTILEIVFLLGNAVKEIDTTGSLARGTMTPRLIRGTLDTYEGRRRSRVHV